jgi:hypothetical protein
MSTYYKLRCGACEEQGGHFTRQAWGWGNADVIENTVFLMAHADCFDRYQGDPETETITIISEHDREYNNDEESLKWIENLQDPKSVAGSAFPHCDEWKLVADGGDIKAWWQASKSGKSAEADELRSRLSIKAERLLAKKALRQQLLEQENLNIQARIDQCIAGGGHHWNDVPLSVQDGKSMAMMSGNICTTCGLTNTGAMII